MTAGFIIRVILEVVAVLALAYGFMHEDKVVAFEDRMLEKFRARKAEPKARKAAEKSYAETVADVLEEREARAREAAYCRNQAAAMRAQAARSQGEHLKPVSNIHTSHVA